MNCSAERKITQAYQYITERICDNVNYVLNKLIEKGTFRYTIKDEMDSVSASNPLAKGDFLLRMILYKNAGHDFLDVLNETGRYGDIFQKISNQDGSTEGTFRCECCKQMASHIEDKIGEMRAEYEHRLQQYQEESERRLQIYQDESERRQKEYQDESERNQKQYQEDFQARLQQYQEESKMWMQQYQEESEKKWIQNWIKLLKTIRTPRWDSKRNILNQKLREKRKSAKRRKADSRRSEIASLKAESAVLKIRTEELERKVLDREQKTNDFREERNMPQNQLDDTTMKAKSLQL
ncbi:hypothetical protein ACJMK2_018791, partial [Sinanodonta woodiana]